MTLDEAIKHAEEVVEAEEENAEWFYNKESSIYRKKCIKRAEEHRQLAEWLKELKQLREQTRWIPVSERLPEVGIDVLVCDMEGTIYLSHVSSFGSYFDEWGNRIKNVRAWMPLPEAYDAYEPQEQCANCKHYGKLSLDCGRCDDDCSMFEPRESEEEG